jgi:DNA-binding Lrp family transcriptional regulator
VASSSAYPVLDLQDQRLIAALQCDGRLAAERAADVLGVSVRTVRRRWQALTADGTLRVVVTPTARPAGGSPMGALFLRIRVLRGKLDTIVAALAARDDIPFIDVTTSGDEILAVSRTEPGSRDPLVFRQLPSTQAVTSIETATVLRVFKLTSDWRHDVLTPEEREALTLTVPRAEGSYGVAFAFDAVERAIMDALTPDARLPAATVAALVGHPESTVRRRIAQLTAAGALVTQVAVDHRRLGLAIDANVMLRVPPDHLDAAGRALAAHPAVHGAFATSGASNLNAAVWLRDLSAFYDFLSGDLTGLGITHAESAIISHPAKRPGTPPHRREAASGPR